MGRLRCPQEVSGTTGDGTVWGEAQPFAGFLLTRDPQGCGAAFSSLMGYQYHQQRCGKPPCEVDSPSFPCTHCGKTYRSKAGHDYHMRSEHTAPVSGQSACPSGSEYACPAPPAPHLLMCPCPQHMSGSPHLQAMWLLLLTLASSPCSPRRSPRTSPLRPRTCWVSSGPPAAASAARRPRLPCSTCRRLQRTNWPEIGPRGG